MMHTPAHKFNRDFQEGITTGKLKLALTILDIIEEKYEKIDGVMDIYDHIDILDEIAGLCKNAIPR